MENPEVSIVIPTLNEEQNLPNVLRDISDYFKRHKTNYEVIVVDGHSEDGTVEIAKQFDCRIIFDDVGKGSALRKGVNDARGEFIITMDADCSHTVEEFPSLLNNLKKGFDICMGSRFISEGKTDDMTYLRKIGNKCFVKLVNSIWGTEYSDLCYGYRSFRKGCLTELELYSDGFGIEAEISIKAAKKGLRVIEIPSYEKKRKDGKGKLKTVKDGMRIFSTILKESVSR